MENPPGGAAVPHGARMAEGEGRKKADLPFRLPLCAGPAGEGAYGGKWAAAAYWEMPGYCLCAQAFPFQQFNLSQPVRGCQGLKKRRSRRHSSLHGCNAQYPPAAFSKAGRLLQVCAIKSRKSACLCRHAKAPRLLCRGACCAVQCGMRVRGRPPVHRAQGAAHACLSSIPH